MARKPLRWQDLDHSEEALLEYVVGRGVTQTRGPIAEFLAKKKAEQAPRTHEWYHDSLMQFWAFVEERGLTTIGQFNEHAVNLFRSERRERNASENTISNRLRAIRAFGRWMAQKGWTADDPLTGLRIPPSSKPHFDLIPDEVRAKLFSLFSADTFLGSRNLAILAILSDTGLRREEAANLILKEVDLDAHMLRVYADKVDEWRYVPLTDEAAALVRNHLKWRDRYFTGRSRQRLNGSQNHRKWSPREIQSDHLFLAWDGRALTPHGLAQILEYASKKLGYRIHAHLFRHDWITRKALDGESPSVVRRWAGHKTYFMTDYYFGLAEELLGAIKPKRSVLSAVTVPGLSRRGRPPKSASK